MLSYCEILPAEEVEEWQEEKGLRLARMGKTHTVFLHRFIVFPTPPKPMALPSLDMSVLFCSMKTIYITSQV
jgi:hypothetical protein